MQQNRRFRHSLSLVVLLIMLAYWSQADYFGFEIIAEIAVFAILAMSLDLIAGYAGMVSLGHAALFGFGAYIYALFTTIWGWPASLGMAGATLATGIVALLVGSVVTRVHGIFFIMITLAIGEMGYEFFFKNRTLGGDDGLAGIDRLDLSAIGVDLMDPASFALFVIVVAAVVYLLLLRLLASPYGKVLVGLHDNPGRLRALGLPVRAYQTSAFALSGLVAGLAGTLTAQHTLFISPNLLHWTTSGEVLVMIILGGLGTLVGAVVGAGALVLLRHELSNYTEYWGFWMGLFLIAIVLGGRNGLVGWLEWAWQLVSRRDRGKEEAVGEDAADKEARDAAS